MKLLLLTTSDVARRFNPPISPRRVQQLGDSGILKTIRTASGQRLFDADDVDRVVAERRQRNEPSDPEMRR